MTPSQIQARRRIALLASFALVAGLHGCGGGSSTSAAPAPVPTPTPSPPPPPPPPGPTATSVDAATRTAANNSLCSAIKPFYWEIGDKTQAQASASVGSGYDAGTVVSIASASKWVYGTYVVQKRGNAGLSASDINFLHFTSGYTNMGNVQSSFTCVPGMTVDQCLNALTMKPGATGANGKQVSSTVGAFDYDSGHLETHASQAMNLGGMDESGLTAEVAGLLGGAAEYSHLVYGRPLLAGGLETSASDYGRFLRKILVGGLRMHDVLGTNAVCTNPATCAQAQFSPIPENWHYSMAHWVEDDPAVHGDGAFSSAGAFGFYPWIDSTKTWYGVISREDRGLSADAAGYASAQCGRLIRHAWMTGREQTGAIPD